MHSTRNIILITLVYLVSAHVVFAANSAGLVDGIWFSREPVTDFGETEVHSVIHNQTDDALQGIATLFVDGVAVGAQEMRVGANNIERIEIPHLFSAGAHKVRMSFTAGGGTEITRAELATKNIFVLTDTDGDGIQNTTDTDDDNDGIPDTQDAQPLVKQIIQKPSVDVSDTGRAFLAKITGRSEEGKSSEVVGEAAQEDANAIIAAFQALEDARKRGAVVVRGYEEERRAALEEIERVEEGLPAVEGFETPSSAEESKKREHQIAAAGSATIGTVLEEEWLFYFHILILVLSVLHLVWGWFKRKFAGVEEEYEE